MRSQTASASKFYHIWSYSLLKYKDVWPGDLVYVYGNYCTQDRLLKMNGLGGFENVSANDFVHQQKANGAGPVPLSFRSLQREQK
jgi:hypothetical protein